jgi:hypothetical protein
MGACRSVACHNSEDPRPVIGYGDSKTQQMVISAPEDAGVKSVRFNGVKPDTAETDRSAASTPSPRLLFLDLRHQTAEGRCVRVIDGDTMCMDLRLEDGAVVRGKVRIAGINAPEVKRGSEVHRAHGRACREALVDLMKSLPVCAPTDACTARAFPLRVLCGTYSWERLVGTVFLPPHDEPTENRHPLASWMPQHTTTLPHAGSGRCHQQTDAELEARAAQLPRDGPYWRHLARELRELAHK